MIMKNMITEIEKKYYEKFPNSRIFVKFSKNFYPSISIVCYLCNDQKEEINGYWDNDILHISFMISAENFREFSKDINLESDLLIIGLENNHNSYYTKPESVYMAYGSKKISFRKVQGNPEKIIRSLDLFFEKLKTSLLESLNDNNIHANHFDLVKMKLQ